jgi:hypothetical protein
MVAVDGGASLANGSGGNGGSQGDYPDNDARLRIPARIPRIPAEFPEQASEIART